MEAMEFRQLYHLENFTINGTRYAKIDFNRATNLSTGKVEVFEPGRAVIPYHFSKLELLRMPLERHLA